MHKTLARILSFPVFIKKHRKKFRSFLEDFHFSNFVFNIKQLIVLSKISGKNKIALMELNSFHLECLYSIYKYFDSSLQLKKEIIIFTTPKNIKLNLFSSKDVKIYAISPFVVKILDCFRYFNQFSFVFVNSYYIWEPHKSVEFYYKNYLKKSPLYVIDHAPGVFSPIYSENKNIKKFVLAEFLSQKYKFPFIYTCIYPTKNTSKQKKYTFLSIGNESKGKDIHSLIKFCEENSISSCIIGPTSSKNQNIIYPGKVSFDDLFKYCYNSKFLPILIHNDISYYLSAISGNLNLALAFPVVSIIDKRLGKLYGLSNEEAILYDGKKDFIRALQYALTLEDKDYKSMLKKMSEKRKLLVKKSKENIIDTIKQ